MTLAPPALRANGAPMKLRQALMVTYHFPPLGGSGVQRAVKLARYLPSAGWRVHVLTAGHRHYSLLDPSLSEDVTEPTRVWRVCGMEPGALAFRICRQLRHHDRPSPQVDALEDHLYWWLEGLSTRLHLPETELLWVPAAVCRARRLMQRHRIEAVITTSPPNAVHLVGLALKRRLGLPWVADLRDPMLDNFAHDSRSRAADLYLRWIEEAVLNHADRCVVTCPELGRRLGGRYDKLPAERICTITNGFDPADAPDQAARPEPMAIPSAADHADGVAGQGRFKLTYVGAFYRQQSIEPILEAIRRARFACRALAERFEFRVVGSISAAQKQLLRDEHTVFLRQAGYLPHRQAVQEVAAADALLLTTPDNDGGRLCIPAKVFEYLAFGPHLIAVVHPGTMLWNTIAQTGNATLLPPGDATALASAIQVRFDAWQAGQAQPRRDPRLLVPFRRDRLARRFAEVLERCVDGGPLFHIADDQAAAREAV